MITDATRISIYDYMASVFDGMTANIYPMSEPAETTSDDVENGFLVTNVGDVVDESEFDGDAYGWVRCYVTAYVPKKTRGRLNKELYKTFEDDINASIKDNTGLNNDGGYYIQEDSVLSMEGSSNEQKGNQYHLFVKSFVVVIDQQSSNS